MIKRNVVSGDIEKRIIIGMIVDDNFCGQMSRMAKKQYFKIDFSITVFQWVLDYYKIYKKAPGKEIQNIFSVEQEKLKESNANLISEFLLSLSENYEENGKINVEHLVDQAREYFRERSLFLLAEKIQGELARGRIGHAETEVRNFNRVTKDISKWFNPFDAVNINQVFMDDESNKLLKLQGNLGEMIGWLERDWLISFMASMKKGKSWMLQELAIQALMQGLKVAYFSFEMSKNVVSKRIYKRLSAMASTPGEYKYPVFDCERNQDNSCKREDRICKIGIKAPGGKITEYKEVKGYSSCQICRNKENGPYERATWFEIQKQKKEFDQKQAVRKAKDFKLLYGDNLRIMAYPAFSASFDDSESDLNDLEAQEGFIADVLCYDYFDITNPGQGVSGFSERATADYVWKKGKSLASKRHCLVATVLQSNRKSINKKSLEQEDTGEDIRKLAHPDAVMGFNQTKDEKGLGVSRVNMIVHRHEDFNYNKEVMVLQSFNLGQPWLDDELVENLKNE